MREFSGRLAGDLRFAIDRLAVSYCLSPVPVLVEFVLYRDVRTSGEMLGYMEIATEPSKGDTANVRVGQEASNDLHRWIAGLFS